MVTKYIYLTGTNKFLFDANDFLVYAEALLPGTSQLSFNTEVSYKDTGVPCLGPKVSYKDPKAQCLNTKASFLNPKVRGFKIYASFLGM